MLDLKPWLRRRCLAWIRGKLQTKSTPLPDFKRGETLLVIAPHQDDEALGCGGLIVRCLNAGVCVQVVFITDGSRSHPGHPEVSAEQLAALRAGEARVATGILGVPGKNLHFLNAPDGRLPHLDESETTRLVNSLRGTIETLRPDLICVCSALDGSSEHEAACELLGKAVVQTRIRVFEYLVWAQWSPRLLFRVLRSSRTVHRCELSPETSALKRNAIRAYRSQVEPLAPWTHSVLSAEFLRTFETSDELFLTRPHPTAPSHAQPS